MLVLIMDTMVVNWRVGHLIPAEAFCTLAMSVPTEYQNLSDVTHH